MKKSRIIEMLPSISFGDGVSGDCLAIKRELREKGYEVEIYADHIDGRLEKGSAKSTNELPRLNENDIILYHLAIGTDLNLKMLEMPGKKIIRYHNITPPEFFEGYSDRLVQLCRDGLIQVAGMTARFHHLLSVSEFNRSCLSEMGYQGDSAVAPIMIPFEDYRKEPDETIIEKYGKDDIVNFVFVGRLVPNKTQEDIIKIFYYYKKYYNNNARLFLVGACGEMDLYEYQLKKYVKELGVEDVYFTGHVSFPAILAYYKVADVLLCTSRHEGFCIPLVEAMFFDVPIIAFDSSAIGETLGGSGCLLKQRNCLEAAALADRIVNNSEFKNFVIEGQRKRLQDFSNDKVFDIMINYINKVAQE